MSRYLEVQDGMYTEAEDVDGRVHITEVQIDDGVYLTREQIAELARRFPVLPAAAASPQPCQEPVIAPMTPRITDAQIIELQALQLLTLRIGREVDIRDAVAAERERCAKIAEEYKCGGEKWDCGAIAAKIRSGE